MAKQYDSTLKSLIERYPFDWLKFCGVEPHGPVSLIDSDVSTFTAAADRVIHVAEPSPWLANIELQASYDPQLAERTHFYSTLLSRRHGLPVRRVIVLLRREADGPNMSGTWTRDHPRTGRHLRFSFDVVRVWPQSADELLQSGPGIWPLATITDDAESRLADIISLSTERIESAFPDGIEGRELQAAEFVLLGLRHSPELIEQLLKGVTRMEESTTYQAILAKGKNIGRLQGKAEGKSKGLAEGLAEGRLEMLIASIRRIGRHRFKSEPPLPIESMLKAMTDIPELELLEDRVLDANGWDELLSD